MGFHSIIIIIIIGHIDQLGLEMLMVPHVFT